MKYCSKCDEHLPESEFGKRKGNIDGLNGRCKICVSIERAQYVERKGEQYREEARERQFKAAHGLTYADRDRMYANQNGCCDICKEAIPLDKIAVDHNHTTNKVRGLLCYSCNRNLVGIDNDEWLQKALDYLDKHGDKE